MVMKIGRTSLLSRDAVPHSRPSADQHWQRVDDLEKSHNDINRGKLTQKPRAQTTTQTRAQFKLALENRGIEGRLANQLLALFDVLLASDEQSATQLATLMLSAVDADAVTINRQFFETASMITDAVLDDGLPDIGLVLERFAETLEGGRVNRLQHTDLRTLIKNQTSDVEPATAVTTESSNSVEVKGSPRIAPASDRHGIFPQASPDLSGSLPDDISPASVPEARRDSSGGIPTPDRQEPTLTELPTVAAEPSPLTPIATGVDPQQRNTTYGQSDDVAGLNDQEFVHALFGSAAVSGLNQAEQLGFRQYARSLFVVYANDQDVLFDDEITRMQDDGILVEAEEGWTLDRYDAAQ